MAGQHRHASSLNQVLPGDPGVAHSRSLRATSGSAIPDTSVTFLQKTFTDSDADVLIKATRAVGIWVSRND